MPDTEVKQLYNRSSLAPPGVAAATPIFFSLPFILIGLGIMIGAPFALKNEPNAPPVFVGIAFGASFFMAGMLAFSSGVRGIWARKKQAERSTRANYWELDYAWDPNGRSSTGMSGFAGSLMGVCFMAVFLTPFNWFAFGDNEMPFFAKGIIGFFDLFLIGLLCYALYVLARWFKYGTSRLEFSRFPYFLGESFDAKFRSRSIGRFRSFTITLRCIEESLESTGDGQSTVFRQIYADQIAIKEPGVHENLGDALPVTFNLPNGNYGTKIAGCAQPRYWELEIHADTPGVDFKAQFLVPVYAREQTGRSTTEDTENTEEKIGKN